MKDLKNDFESFVNNPEQLQGSDSVLKKIHSEIQRNTPALHWVIAKIGVAHFIGSLITLMSCSQFGFQLFFNGGGLMHLFMKVSPSFCYVCCGALYLSLSILAARIILNYDEWLIVLCSKVLSISSLALISLGTLAVVTHEVNLESGALWFFGAALGGEMITLVKSPGSFFRKLTSL